MRTKAPLYKALSWRYSFCNSFYFDRIVTSFFIQSSLCHHYGIWPKFSSFSVFIFEEARAVSTCWPSRSLSENSNRLSISVGAPFWRVCVIILISACIGWGFNLRQQRWSSLRLADLLAIESRSTSSSSQSYGRPLIVNVSSVSSHMLKSMTASSSFKARDGHSVTSRKTFVMGASKPILFSTRLWNLRVFHTIEPEKIEVWLRIMRPVMVILWLSVLFSSTTQFRSKSQSFDQKSLERK